MRGAPVTRLPVPSYRPRQRLVAATARPRWLRALHTPRWGTHLALFALTLGLLPWGLRPAAVAEGGGAPTAGRFSLLSSDAERVAVRHHIVGDGESLASIAAHHGLRAETVRWANGLGDLDPLLVGQELRLPPVDGLLHYVAAGETARQVALYYGVDVDAVAAYNHVADADRPLRSAQLMVPEGRPRWGEAVASLGSTGYVRERGEAVPEGARQLQFADVTLWVVDDPERQVAARAAAEAPAKTWMQVEAEAAHATAAALDASQSATPKPIDYEVRAGDTITGLADRFGITPLTIVAANDLRNRDTLQVGQPLVIPPVTGALYSVQENDTLYEIALRFRVDLGPIVDYNGLESAEALRLGQRLVIPGAEPGRPPEPARPATARGLLAGGQREPDTVRLANVANRVRGEDSSEAARVAAPSPAIGGGVGDDDLASFAMQFLGRPYVFGGTTPSGFDCSGFVFYVHRQKGVPLSRGMMGQYTAGPHIARDALRPGDIVFFSNTYMPGLSHNGIYIGNGKFVHASHPGVGVVVSGLAEPYWASRYSGATRAH